MIPGGTGDVAYESSTLSTQLSAKKQVQKGEGREEEERGGLATALALSSRLPSMPAEV